MNPFRKSSSPLRPVRDDDVARWVSLEGPQTQLAEYVYRRENTVILGVEGSGKTTLLNMFFTPEYCKEAAKNHTLIFFADLSDAENGQDLCRFLIRQLQVAVHQRLPEAEALALDQTLANAKEEHETLKQQFILGCECLYQRNYNLLLIMDGFERFVSSPHIKQDHHDMLRSLLDQDIMRCVVATNYDLQKSSLPKDIQGSLYLQKFQSVVTVRGFCREEAKAFIARNLPAGDPVQLTERQIKFLFDVTGGVPLLFEMGASHMYDILQGGGRIKSGEFQTLMYDRARYIMGSWFKHFTVEYDLIIHQALSKMPDDKSLLKIGLLGMDGDVTNPATRLCERGLWTPVGNHAYCFNSLLLQRFARDSYLPSVVIARESALQQAMPKREHNVFISYKRTDGEVQTKDCEIALAVYDALRQVEGLVPFLDVKEIPKAESNDFNSVINTALKTAQAFVYICTNPRYVNESSYITWECDNYLGALASGKKPRGSVYGVLEKVCKEIVDGIPDSLVNTVDLYGYNPEDIQRLVNKIKNRLLG